MERKKMSTRKLVLGALLTALVLVLQFMGASIRFGTFSISLVLIPIVIGAVTCGKAVGSWLGLVFGIAVLASGDAAPFMTVNAVGTIVTVLLKGTACGFVAGLVYQSLKKAIHKEYLSAVVSALVCPVVNTGVFLLGCKLFFMETITVWAGGTDVGKYMIFSLAGGNFLFEMLVNIIFAPAIVQILKIVNKER